MYRKQATLTVTVDLDLVPGTFYTAESARNIVERILMSSIGHYKPIVELVSKKE